MTPTQADFPMAFRAFCQTVQSASKGRFAPTPSGYLHLGNAVNFTLNWLAARLSDGKILLRIDDLDAGRKRPEYVQDVFDTLDWLGLDWDEGPRSPEAFERHWSQHRRLPLYHALLERLLQSGLVFPCGKSRRELAPYGDQYPPQFRKQGLRLDDPEVSWRIATPPGFPMPDFVVRRRDGLPAYQVASVADDLLFGVTHAIRGSDLEPSTAAQQWLATVLADQEAAPQAAALPWADFAQLRFLHHPLLLDAAGLKLSKSAGATSLKNLRETGVGPAVVFQQTAHLLLLPDPEQVNGKAMLLECLGTFFK